MRSTSSSPVRSSSRASRPRCSSLPTRRVRNLAGDAALNDPVAVLLVLVAVDLLAQHDFGALDALVFLMRQVGVAIAVGQVVGRLALISLRRLETAPPSINL